MLPQAIHLTFSECDALKDLLEHEDAEITQLRAGTFINTVSLEPLEHMVFRYGTKTTPADRLGNRSSRPGFPLTTNSCCSAANGFG
jgi:hypothetical protein